MAVSIDDLNDSDRQIWEEELAEFVPDRMFDAHCHMFRGAHLRPEAPRSECGDVDLSTLQDWAEALFPGRRTNFLVLGQPHRGIDPDRHNQFLGQQVARDPGSRANRLVTPDCNVQKIEEDIEKYGFVGLKPYRVFSMTGDVDNCRIHEFLTHEQMELANHLGLWVTMHLSRSDGCADQHNLDDLEEYTTRRYPNIKWILAHCARSFTYWPIRQAVGRLRDMPNIWYDLSAVTNMHPILTLFQEEDIKRLFYGSDGVDSAFFHGKYVTFGRYWFQVYPDQSDFSYAHTTHRPITAIYEQVLGMKMAAEIAGFSREDIERVFWRNAYEALGIPIDSGVSSAQGAS